MGAFQVNTGHRFATGASGTVDTQLGMRPGTSPGITVRPSGGFELAFQGNTTTLWAAGNTSPPTFSSGHDGRHQPRRELSERCARMR